MAEERRRTTARRDLDRLPGFSRVSPAPGQLDESAFDEAAAEDRDQALGLLAELAGATDPELRDLARRLAGRVLVRMARTGPARRAGVGRLHVGPMEAGADLDVDASIDELVRARGAGRAPELGELRARRWARPATGLCLLIDRSGSMGGKRLAAAALAAAAVAWRAPADHSVVAFSDDAVVLKAQDETRPAESVVDEILALRGHGTTDLALALDAARRQLARSPARDRLVVLMSDGRATTGLDPLPAARALDRLAVLAPRGDAAEAALLAAAAGGRLVELGGPSDIPEALAQLVGG